MKSDIIVGRFTGSQEFLTADGSIVLTKALPGQTPGDHPFQDAVEMEQYAVLTGILQDGVLYDAVVMEVLPTIASELLQRYLDAGHIDRKDLEKRVLAILEDVIGPAEPEPEPEDVVPSFPRPLVALVVGHRKSSQGAESKTFNITEWVYNDDMAKRVKERVKLAEVAVVYRDDAGNGYTRLPAKINGLDPDFIVSLHCNFTVGASGTEMLHHHQSRNSERLASMLQNEVLKALGLRDRGLRPRSSGRGWHLLSNTKAPAVIVEPFFMSNDREMKLGLERKDELAAAYAAAIDDYAASVSTVRLTEALTTEVERSHPSEEVGGMRFLYRDMSKEQFFEANDGSLEALIEESNQWRDAKNDDDADLLPLTKEEVWVVFYTEMGLDRRGKIDPLHIHSEGERGLLPLPDKIRFWIGEEAPTWNKPMPLVENLRAFTRYLATLKNRVVKTDAGHKLYRALFEHSGIQGNPVREARMLASVVHGYFYRGAYRPVGPVPYEKILEGLEADKPIPEVMEATNYRWAGTDILKNREKNIRRALDLLADT